METKHPENELLRRNSSDNFTGARNQTTREYAFAPVSYHVKIIIFAAMLFFGVYGFIANFLILYFKHKQHKRRRHTIKRAFSRSLTEYFINSLALSDLLCSLISLPLFTTEMFVDFVKNNSICRFNRFLNVLFPVITILSLLFIGVERYLVIFHPFSVLNQRKAKRMVIGAWVLGTLITFVSVPTFRLVYYEDIGDDFYTLVCKYDSSVPLFRALFTSFFIIIYFIPSIILIFINLRILKRQRFSQHVGPSQNARKTLSRIKVTRMFVSLIFAFIIPYMAFFFYTTFRTASKLNVSFSDDYIVRNINVLLAYANGSVSATILMYYEKLYLNFLSCFRPRSTTNEQSSQGSDKTRPEFQNSS